MHGRFACLKWLKVALLGSALIVGFGATALAAPKVPATPEEHFALSKQYRDKAGAYKKEATEHREMAAAYKKSAINAHEKQGQKDPFVAKMEKHCTAIAAKADALATENQKAADYHDLRGKELQGK